jgi:hypothetical protein
VARRILYVVFGVLAVLIGLAILVWVLYNLLIAKQPEFQAPRHPGAYLFPVFMIGGGVVMLEKGIKGSSQE